MSRMMCKYLTHLVCKDEFTDKDVIANDCENCSYYPIELKEKHRIKDPIKNFCKQCSSGHCEKCPYNLKK